MSRRSGSLSRRPTLTGQQIFDQAIRDAFGWATYGGLFTQDPTSWAGYTNGVRVENFNT